MTATPRQNCIFCDADAYPNARGEWECDRGHVYAAQAPVPERDVRLREALDVLLELDEARFDAIALVAREEVRAALATPPAGSSDLGPFGDMCSSADQHYAHLHPEEKGVGTGDEAAR